MKKLILLLLTALLTVTGLYAISISEYADPSSWIPESLYIGMGNDKWALANISYNMDDQLSFSEHFYVEAPAYWLDVNMLAITNRGWQNEWSTLDFSAEGDGNKIDGRYDVTQIFFSLPLDLLVTDNFYIWIRPEAGVSIIGDQNYAFLQNTLHKLINAAPLEVDYETPGKNMAKLSLNMSAEVGGLLLRFGESLLSISARADFMNTIGFGYKQHVYGALGLISKENDILTMGLGYSFCQSASGWKTQEIYYEYLKGPIFTLSVNSGLIRFDYFSRLRTGFGYGVISVDVLSLFKKSTWKESELFLSMGISSQLNNTFYNVRVGAPIKGTGFSLIASTRFLSGNPSYKNWENMINPENYPRFKRSYSALLLGVRYDFADSRQAFVTPYAELTAGIMSWEVRELWNMVTDYTVYDEQGQESTVRNKIHSLVKPKLLSFAADLELGLTFIPEGAFRTGNSTFRINFFSGVTFIHNPKAVGEYLSYSTDDSVKIGRLIPRWGVGIQIGFDL